MDDVGTNERGTEWNFDAVRRWDDARRDAACARMGGYRTLAPFTDATAAALGAVAGRGLVLEVGPGSGDDAAELEAGGDRVVGVDLCPAIVRRRPWALLGGAADALPVRDKAMPAVLANRVLHHIADPVAFFAEVHRVLAPGAVAAFVWPDRERYDAHVAGEQLRAFQAVPGGTSVNPALVGGVVAQATGAGLEMVRLERLSARVTEPVGRSYAITRLNAEQRQRTESAAPGSTAALDRLVDDLEAGRGWVQVALAVLVLRRGVRLPGDEAGAR